MTDFDLPFKSTAEHARLLHSQAISPVELLKLYLDRIEKFNPALNAFLAMNIDAAIEKSKEIESCIGRGETLGPLYGIPFGVKDNEVTKGIETTHGSAWMKGHIPKEDSVVVERINAAGGIIIGKTNMPDWGLMIHSENRLGDHTRNPWDTSRTSGGSSAGSASAVAAGLCSIASGTDGGGSIRAPSSFCGMFGIRPTLGRVPRYSGASENYITNPISQPGPIARTVEDAAILLQILAGFDLRDPDSVRADVPAYPDMLEADLSQLKIAYSPDYGYAEVNTEVNESVEAAVNNLVSLGCRVDLVELDLADAFYGYWPLISANWYASLDKKFGKRLSELAPEAFNVYQYGSKITGKDYALALGVRDQVISRLDTLFTKYDLLLSPTMPNTAFPAGKPKIGVKSSLANDLWGFPAHSPFTFPINAAGLPGANIPCGFDKDGLPIGLQVIGRRFEELRILQLSYGFEQAYPWPTVPPLFDSRG
tara:strand:- start:2515 stop:3954 length:1440 start_codon:yes stop_codon:yes gene_type:complete